MTDQSEATCIVCGITAPLAMTAECNWCGNRFHLNQRNDVEGKDCGSVWIDEQFLALQFACQRCLDGEAAPAPASNDAASRSAQSRPRRYRRRA